MRSSAGQGSAPPQGAIRAAQAALLIGLLYAGVSVYWGLGGTWLLDTVGDSLEHRARAGAAGVLLAVWVAVVLKVIAALLPLLAVRGLSNPARTRQARILAWSAALILTGYGAVLTVAGLLVQARVARPTATADHRALAWHAYLWDPWFLVWGLLIAISLRSAQRRPAHQHANC